MWGFQMMCPYRFGKIFPRPAGPLAIEPGREEVPSEVTVHVEQPAITIVKERRPLTLKQADLEGRIAIVYAEGLLPSDKAFSTKQLNRIMESRFGTKEFPGHFAKVLAKFVAWGYMEKVGHKWALTDFMVDAWGATREEIEP